MRRCSSQVNDRSTRWLGRAKTSIGARPRAWRNTGGGCRAPAADGTGGKTPVGKPLAKPVSASAKLRRFANSLEIFLAVEVPGLYWVLPPNARSRSVAGTG